MFRPGNRKSEPRKLKQRKNQDSRRAKIWSGWEKNLIKEERKEKIPKTTIKIFHKGCKLLYISVQGGEGHRHKHTRTHETRIQM